MKLTFERIKKECVMGSTVFNNGRTYIGFNRTRLVTSLGGVYASWSENEAAGWTIKQEPKKLYAYNGNNNNVFFRPSNVIDDEFSRIPEYDLEFPCK